MLERGKISCSQAVYLMVILVVSTAIVFLPAITAQAAGRDAWLSPLLTTAPGIYLALVISGLGKRFPGQTIIQYTHSLLGAWPGKVIGLGYLVFFLHTGGIIIREFSDLMTALVLPQTPAWVLNGTMVLLCAWAVRQGLEVTARVVEVTFLPIFVFFSLTVLLVAKDMDLNNLLPVLENGLLPVIRASLPPVGWRGEIILLAMFLPFLARPERAARCGVLAVVFIGVILIMDAIANTAVLGTAVASLNFPTFFMFRRVSIANFLERIDALLVAIWVMSVFGKISLFYYATALGTAQLLNLKDYRPLVFPFGILLTALSLVVVKNSRQMVEYLVAGWPPFAFAFEYFIPTVLFLAAAVRGRAKSKN